MATLRRATVAGLGPGETIFIGPFKRGRTNYK